MSSKEHRFAAIQSKNCTRDSGEIRGNLGQMQKRKPVFRRFRETDGAAEKKTTTVYDATNHTRWSSLDGFNHTFLNLSYSIVFLDQFSCFRSVLNFVFVLFSSRNHFSLGLSSMNISHVYSHTICGFAAHIFMGPEPPSQWSLDG